MARMTNESSGDSTSDVMSSPTPDMQQFVGIDELKKYFYQQLEHFKKWDNNRDWLAFHHHHYDWWMFPIDEISSRGVEFQLIDEDLNALREDRQFITDLRLGVQLMVRSWGWDIERRDYYSRLDDKQKWSYWPVRLYKAGRCMWLFDQMDYYKSLKDLAYRIQENDNLDFYSHTVQGKANVLRQWDEMERNR